MRLEKSHGKRLIILVAVFSLSIGSQPALATSNNVVPDADGIRPVLRAQLPRAFYQEPSDATLAAYMDMGIAFNGGQQALGNQLSYIRTDVLAEDGNLVHGKVCNDYANAPCDSSATGSVQTTASIILPVCSQDDDSACLESISITKNETTTEGAFLEYVNNAISPDREAAILAQEVASSGVSTVRFPTSPEWVARPSDLLKGLPAAKSPSKWRVADIQNKGNTDTYMARATLKVNILPSGEVEFDGLNAEVIPYVETIRGTFYPPTYFTRTYASVQAIPYEVFPGSPAFPLASFDNPNDEDPITCAWEEELPTDSCGIAVQFADGSRTSMTIRIPNQLGGWFHGRVAKADLDLSIYNSALNRLVISAEDVDVPVAGASFPILAPGYETYKNHFTGWIDLADVAARDVADDGLASWSNWSADYSIEHFTAMEPLMGERANGSVNMWEFSTLPQSETENICFADKNRIQGMISTNATVYQAGLPSLSSEGVTYQVGGLHKDYLGEITSGSYSLIMRTEEARCLYELGDAEFTSEVAVTAASGARKSSETSVVNDGTWLRIWADEFNFSSPSISLNLTKASSPAAPTISTPTISTPTIKIATVAKGKSRSSKAVLSDVGIKLAKGQKASISIKKASMKVCSVSGSKVKAKKKGTCSYIVTVKNKKGKKVSTKTGSFTVR